MSTGSKWGGGRQREELQGRRSAGQEVVSLSSQMAHFIACRPQPRSRPPQVEREHASQRLKPSCDLIGACGGVKGGLKTGRRPPAPVCLGYNRPVLTAAANDDALSSARCCCNTICGVQIDESRHVTRHLTSSSVGFMGQGRVQT